MSLSLSLPIERRKARGKQEALQAKLRALEMKRNFQRDKIATEVKDLVNRLRIATERSSLASEAHRLAQRVEAAERRRFDLGSSSILKVNLREEASAKAAKRRIEALMEVRTARAGLDAALFAL